MANRYWVGGTGTWSAASTTNWSATSGGAGGASVPTAADSVFFDQAGTYTVTFSGALACLDFTHTAGTITFNSSGAPTLAISGSFALIAATNWNPGSLTATFNATTTGKTIVTNGALVRSTTIIFNGVGGAWTLGSALSTSSPMTVTAGTFSTSASNYSLTLSDITVQGGTLTLNGSTVSLSATTPFTCSSGTVNAGTSTINCTSSGAGSTVVTFNGGGRTYYNVAFTNNAVVYALINGSNTFNNVSFASVTVDTISIAGTNTFNNLSFSAMGSFPFGPGLIIFSGNQTVNGTLTVPAGANATKRYRFQSNTTTLIAATTARTLTCAAVSLTDVDFVDITAAGAAAPFTGTRLGNIFNNTNITFPVAKTVYWNLAGANTTSAAGWATSSGGAPAANNFPLCQDTMVVDNSSAGTSLDFDNGIGRYCYGTFTSSSRTVAFTVTPASAFAGETNIAGSWSTGSGITYAANNNTLNFFGPASKTLASAGKAFSNNIKISGGSVTLSDALTQGTYVFTLSAGSFNANNYSVTTGAFNGTSSNSKTLAMGSATWTIFAALSNVSWQLTTPVTVTGTATISLTRATAKTFSGGGINYGSVVLNQGGAGALTITGANTFNNITNTYGATGATTITFPASTTTTVSNFTAVGTAGRLLTIDSSSAGTRATLSKTSGTVNANYLNIKDSAATGGAIWNAGANSVNGGNNTGWIFSLAGGNMFLMFS